MLVKKRVCISGLRKNRKKMHFRNLSWHVNSVFTQYRHMSVAQIWDGPHRQETLHSTLSPAIKFFQFPNLMLEYQSINIHTAACHQCKKIHHVNLKCVIHRYKLHRMLQILLHFILPKHILEYMARFASCCTVYTGVMSRRSLHD